MKKIFPFITIIIVLLGGCKKEEKTPIEQLPPATQTGENKFGCLVNGKPFIVDGNLLGFDDDLRFSAIGNYAWSCVSKMDEEIIRMYFDFNSKPIVPGTFELAGDYPLQGIYHNMGNGSSVPNGINTFSTDSVHKGSITLQYYDKKIAAGTFSFDCINDAGKIVHVTDGRFDIKLK